MGEIIKSYERTFEVVQWDGDVNKLELISMWSHEYVFGGGNEEKELFIYNHGDVQIVHVTDYIVKLQEDWYVVFEPDTFEDLFERKEVLDV